MGERGLSNMWLRMTDQSGLIEPGKEARLPSSGILLFAAIGWLVFAMIWLYLGIRTHGEIQLLHGVLVVVSLILAGGGFMEWRKWKKPGDEPGINLEHK